MAADPPIPALCTETARLLVRPLSERDRDEFVRVHTISAASFAPWSPRREDGRSLAEFFDFVLERATHRAATGGGARYVATLRQPGPERIAAFLNLNNIVRGAFQNADAGWSVSVDCAGRGLATEGVTALLDLAFAPAPSGLGLHRVQANIAPANTASLRVAEKCGFRREGLARSMLKIDGAWSDQWMHAKLAEEHRPSRAC